MKIRPFLSGACFTTPCSGSCSVQTGLLRCSLAASSIKPLQLIQNTAARLTFNEPKRTHVTPLFINLHWLAAQCIKFKALMFAYRTTPLPKCITSDLCASRSLRSASERRITVPSQRDTKYLSQTFTLTVPIWWNDSILTHLQETAKNTSLFDPLTLALSIIIIFYLIGLLFYKKNTHLTLYQLHMYSLTASFSCKTNTKCLFVYILHTRFLKIKKKHLPTCTAFG